MSHIYRTAGVRGLFQGHSATLLRIFPYAGIKFMAYDWLESVGFPRTPISVIAVGAGPKLTIRSSSPHRIIERPSATS